MAKALGLTSKVRKVSSSDLNRRARMLVLQYGVVIRDDPNFTPAPPDAIVQRGEHAVQIWLDAWRNGNTMPISRVEHQVDTENAELFAQEAAE